MTSVSLFYEYNGQILTMTKLFWKNFIMYYFVSCHDILQFELIKN